ncbi:MAG: folylpolyglutamate synthase/dihydrofolate synthase family protein [Eubacteriales bacterium]|nr:folylpolyglutamate synthase/dihydrofolate synthase family protein [Eubacteriales bacterium]
MDYQEALEYVFSANKLGIRPGLERMRAIMWAMGQPQERYPIVHIAGTNGKGSIASYLAHIAAASDFKVGWYTSPYLENFTDRIRILDGRAGLERFEKDFRDPEIQPEVFAALVTELRQVVEKQGIERLGVFELITAATYLYFAREQVDIAIIEVGMGGLYDATNVNSTALTTVIGALGFDHMDRLGHSLREIAHHKAGILKTGVPLILYDPHNVASSREEGDQVMAEVMRHAEELSVPVTLVRDSDYQQLPAKKGQRFHYQGEDYQIRLLGDYQCHNACVAIEAARSFAGEAAIKEGLERAIWPGRLEVLRDQPLILLDGAHNPQGCASLCRELDLLLGDQPAVYLTAMMRGKDYPRMLDRVFGQRKNKIDSIYCTRTPLPSTLSAGEIAEAAATSLGLPKNHPRVLASDGSVQNAPEALTNAVAVSRCSLAQNERASVQSPVQAYLGPELPIYYSDDYKHAGLSALKAAEERKLPLVVFGSLYLVGNIRPVIRQALKSEENS